ncbi:MAG: hypothetical protein GF405_09485 [Candidatus Eisenbacteria bacterium]|nr:hypothetical protein [Candidatus Eisenbacteria bacterium]
MRSMLSVSGGWTLPVVLAAMLACAASSAGAGDASGVPGAFADIGIGARAVGLGGSVVAVDGAESLFWNPARLDPGGHSGEAHVSYCDQMGLVPYSTAAGTMRLGGYTVGAGVLYSGDDVLTETTILLGASRPLPELSWCEERSPQVGAAARVRRASFGNNEAHEGQVTGTATGFALDVGATAPLPGGADVGVVWRDALSTLSWDSSAGGTYDEPVPSVIALGVAMTAADRLTVEVGLDTSLEEDGRDIASIGAELVLFEIAALRGGYRTSINDDTYDEFVAGGGVSTMLGTATAGVDVAYVFGQLDDTLRMALTVGWK